MRVGAYGTLVAVLGLYATLLSTWLVVHPGRCDCGSAGSDRPRRAQEAVSLSLAHGSIVPCQPVAPTPCPASTGRSKTTPHDASAPAASLPCTGGSLSGWPRPYHDRHTQQLQYFSWAAAKHYSEVPLGHLLNALGHISALHDELFLPKETHLYALYNKDPKVVLDIGANVGFFSASTILAFQPPCERYRGTMAWARHVTEEYRRKQWSPFELGFDYGHSSLAIHAFEPKAENFHLLNRTLTSFCAGPCDKSFHPPSHRLNYGQRRLQVPPVLQVHSHHVALSNRSGRLKLYNYAKNDKDRNNFGGDELPSLVADPGRANQPFEWAAVTTLDEWWARHRGNHSSVFLAKIDAEKHEWEVLEGAAALLKERVVGIWFWECSSLNATRSIVRKMEDHGYWSYLVGLRSLIMLNGEWTKVFDRGLWANCMSITQDHPLLPLLESVYSVDVVLHYDKPKKYFWNVPLY